MKHERESQPNAGNRDFPREYRDAVQSLMTQGTTNAFEHADSIAREAIAAGVNVVELAAVHHRGVMGVLLEVLAGENDAEGIKAVGSFCASCPAWFSTRDGNSSEGREIEKRFVDSLSKFAASHRGLQLSNEALHRLEEAREAEARRIAHALHDEAEQLLASVHIAVEDLAREAAAPSRERIRGIRKLLDRAQHELRRLAHELRPPVLDTLGLPAAVHLLADGISDRAGTPISVQCSISSRLPPSTETALYWTIKEALANAVKHAQATRIIVQLQETDGFVTCSVKDDGKGFNREFLMSRKSGPGLGLIAMRERMTARGGNLTINSSPGQGTEIVATVSVGADEHASSPDALVNSRPAGYGEC